MRKLKVFSIIAVIAIVAITLGTVVGCEDSGGGGVDTRGSQSQRETDVSQRNQIYQRALDMYPVPDVHFFIAREMLTKYVQRQDQPDHPFYIYILTDIGTILGYYVAQSAPVSINAFLSSTEDIYDDSWGNVLTTAPSVDGIYYGGAGATAGTNGWFFFDAATDALIILYDTKMFVSDQPLNVEAPMINIGIPVPEPTMAP